MDPVYPVEPVGPITWTSQVNWSSWSSWPIWTSESLGSTGSLGQTKISWFSLRSQWACILKRQGDRYIVVSIARAGVKFTNGKFVKTLEGPNTNWPITEFTMAARKERQNSPIYQIYHCPESVPSLAPRLTRWRLNTSMCQKERQKEFYVRRIGSKENRSRVEVNRKTPTQRGISQGCPRNFQSLYQSSWNHKHTLHLVDWYSFFFYVARGLE